MSDTTRSWIGILTAVTTVLAMIVVTAWIGSLGRERPRGLVDRASASPVMASPAPDGILHDPDCPYVEMRRDGTLTDRGRDVVEDATRSRTAVEVWDVCLTSAEAVAGRRWAAVAMDETFDDQMPRVDPFTFAPVARDDAPSGMGLPSTLVVRAAPDEVAAARAAMERAAFRFYFVDSDGTELTADEAEAFEASGDWPETTGYVSDPEVRGDTVHVYVDDLAGYAAQYVAMVQILRDELVRADVERAVIFTTDDMDAVAPPDLAV